MTGEQETSKKSRTIGENVLRGTVVIVLVGVLAKLTSFLSEAILAAFLGTTATSDAYYMVGSIFHLIYPMLSVGIWKVFLPVYKEKIARGQDGEAAAVTDRTLTFFTLVSLAVMGAVFLCAPFLVSVIAPGFRGELRDLCIRLVRISSPMYLPIMASAVYASILQCHNKFLGSQIREVASHIPTILAAVIFYRRFGIEAMALAFVVNGIMRVAVELPFVDWGYRFRPDFHFRSAEFLTMLRRLPSALVSEGVTQLNAMIDKAMASTLSEGTISGLNYGHRLMNVFSGLLSNAIATALYPQMIELIAQKKERELGRLLVRIIDIFCVLMIPVTLACVLFRTELVAAVFQRGSFTAESTALTSGIFAMYCVGIFFVACNTVITDLFYGFGNTRTPMYISIANLGINVVLNLLLIRVMGAAGLALGTSLSAVITFFLRLWKVRRYVPLDYLRMVVTVSKVALGSALACGIPRILFMIWPLNRYLVLILSAAIGAGLYLVLLRLLRVSEMEDVLRLLLRRFSRRKRK